MEGTRLVEVRDVMTSSGQQVSTTALQRRVEDISSWRERLQAETAYLASETDQLERSRAELEHAVRQLDLPEGVVVACMRARDNRQGAEMVEDLVQKGLRTEVAEVRRLREEMVILMDTVDSQLGKNAAVTKRLRQDVSGKQEAQGLDTECHALQDSSKRIQGHPGIEQEDTTKSTQLSWHQHSDKNLSNSTDARARSAELRTKVEALLMASCKELIDAWGASNKNFAERILETEKAMKLSMENLEQTNHELTNMDYNIKLLQKAVEDKRNPRKVAESRLEVRSHRTGQEDCSDLAQAALWQEVSP